MTCMPRRATRSAASGECTPYQSGDCGEEDARRGCHAEVGEVVLGDVIRVEPGALVGHDDLEPLAVIGRERTVALIQVIEDAELHGLRPFSDRYSASATRSSAHPCA